MLGYSKREIKSTSFDNALMENPPLKYVYLSRTYRSSYITCMYICTYVHTMSSVPDPWCFGKDPDPRISTTGLRIRILLFLRSGSHDTKKKKFLFLINYCRYTYISVFKDNKSQSVEIKVFLNFLFVMEGSGSCRTKNLQILRIRIRNTAIKIFKYEN
jgi:hypothetical protein